MTVLFSFGGEIRTTPRNYLAFGFMDHAHVVARKVDYAYVAARPRAIVLSASTLVPTSTLNIQKCPNEEGGAYSKQVMVLSIFASAFATFGAALLSL